MPLIPALRQIEPKRPQTWEELPAGDELKESVEQELKELCNTMFGYHLVKLGSLAGLLDLTHCQIKTHTTISETWSDVCQVVSRRDELSIQNNSVDAFVAAFDLDFAQDPHQVLREIDRTIMANGHLIVVGFNVFSLVGLLKHLPLKRFASMREGRFFTTFRVKDWLNLLGFEIVEHKRLPYSHLVTKTNLIGVSYLARFCQQYLPWFNSVSIIVARKREYPLSLIKPKWRSKPKFSAVGASMRTRL